MKILLIDDEYYILNGLRKLIHSSFPELEIFTGDNVIKAKKILFREAPDILITDIRIAEENGLDLIRSIKKEFENMHIYIISGYSEFEYAKTAIELKVRYYIQKPIDQMKVVELVRQSIEEIQDGKIKKEDQAKNRELARKKIISDMISAGRCTQELYEESKRLHMISLFERYRVMSVSIKEYWIIATYRGSIQLSNLKMFLRKKLDDIFEKAGWTEYLFVDDDMGNYTVIIAEDSGTMDSVFKHIHQALFEDFKLYVEIQVSGEYKGIDHFYAAYCESRGIESKTSRVIFFNDNEGRIIKELEDIRYKVVEAMKQENFLKLISLSDIIRTRFCKGYSDNQAVRNFSGELYRELINYAEESIKKFMPREDEEAPRKLEEYKPEATENLEEAYSGLGKLFQFCQKRVNLSKNQDMVNRVIEYMDDNIDNVTLDNAAMHVETTPIYLSIIFREIHGVNFKECLIQKKIEKAKEMLCNTDYRIYEISSKVGYSDIKYFSKIFKRHTGMGPQEYRKQYIKEKEEDQR